MNQNKTTPILLTIIAILFVSILVTLAVYLPKNQSAPVKIDVALTPTGTPVATTVPTTPSTSAIPKDWKTYINSDYNISFKYPPNLSVTYNKDTPDSGISVSTTTRTDPFIRFLLDPYKTQTLDFFKQEPRNVINEPTELPSIKIANKYYIVSKYTEGGGGPDVSSIARVYFIDINNKMLVSLTTYSQERYDSSGNIIEEKNNFDEVTKIALQILTSLKFTQ